MDTATGKLVATKEESGDVDLSESETWNVQEEAVTERQNCLYNSYVETPMHPVNQTTRKIPKLKGKNGHTIYTCLQPQFITWKQSSRSSGGCTNENQMILCMTWT